MMVLCRLACVLAAALLGMPVLTWLALSALAMLGFYDALWGNEAWMRFCGCASLACIAPSAIRMATPHVPWRAALREGSRGALISFAMFACGLFLFVKPALQFIGLPMLMAQALADSLGGVLACPLFFASWLILEKLLPLPSGDDQAPKEMRLFRILSITAIALLTAAWFTAQQFMAGTPASSFFFGAVWIALALRRGVMGGHFCSVLAWVSLCTCLAALFALLARQVALAQLCLAGSPIFLLLLSCASLCRPSIWRWLS